MPLISPYEDFARSVSEIPSISGRLAYMAELLRQGGGKYAHWGMDHHYGVERSQAAMVEVHECVLRLLLGSRCQDATADLVEFAHGRGILLFEAFEAISSEGLPEGLSKAERRHFKAVVSALDALFRHDVSQAA